MEKLAIHGGAQAFRKNYPELFSGAEAIDHAEIEALREVVESKSLFRFYGPDLKDKVFQFEKAFSEKMGMKYALGVTSGTAALKVALAASGVGYGDEVIIPANTFIASASAVVSLGAIPVIVDIDDSLNMDPALIEDKITPRTRAIMPVHMMGVACEMDAISAIARKHDLRIVEDCAQSLGTKYKDCRVGSFSDIAAFSLQFQKVLTAGEGGAVATDSPHLYERAVRCHDHGVFRGIITERTGVQPAIDPFFAENYRMSELTGAVAYVQIRKLDSLIENMRRNKYFIKNLIKDLNQLEFRRVVDEEGDIGASLSIYLQDTAQRDEFIRRMKAEGVPLLTCYGGMPIYQKNAHFQHLLSWHWKNYPFADPAIKKHIPDYGIGSCPVAEELLARECHLYPISPFFSEEDCRQIAEAFRKVANSF